MAQSAPTFSRAIDGLHAYVRAQPDHRVHASKALTTTADGEQIRKQYPSKPITSLVKHFPRLFRFELDHLIAKARVTVTHVTTPLPARGPPPARGSSFAKAASLSKAWEVYKQLPRRASDDNAGNIDASLRAMLPPEVTRFLEEKLSPDERMRIRDIIFDNGKPVYCWLAANPQRKRVDVIDIETSGTLLATPTMLEHILQDLPGPGEDNRTGPEDGLHRVSVLRNKNGNIYGLTLRVARIVGGALDPVRDLVEDASTGSILVLGPPNSGKTTLIREIARHVAETEAVVIVDTSNEIGGNSDGPALEVLGQARRAMVATRDSQKDVMVEVVQNHSPDLIVVDEIGRKREVEAAATIRERGVRILASAHGCSLDNLIQNRDLMGMAGGVQSVLLGDLEATKLQRVMGKAELQKTKRERVHKPVFDAIIIMDPRPGAPLQVITSVTRAVDNLLRQMPYEVELRAVVRAGAPFAPLELTSASISEDDIPAESPHDRVLRVKVNSSMLLR